MLVASGYCPKHERTAAGSDYQRRKRADQAKGPERQFYSTREWRRIRAVVLREEPFCACGCGRTSNTVDHVKNRRAYPELALERTNLRGWYDACHNRKTASQDGGFGNRRKAGAP